MRLPASSYAFLCLRTGKILFKRRPSSKGQTREKAVHTDEMLMVLYAIFLHTNDSSWSSSMSDYRCGDLHHVFVKHTYFDILGIFTVTNSVAVEKDQKWNLPFDNALIRFVGEFDDILNDATKRRNATLATFAGFKKSIEVIAKEHCTELLGELGACAQIYCSGDDYCSAAFKLQTLDGEQRYVQKLVASRGMVEDKDLTRVMAAWLEEMTLLDDSGSNGTLGLPCNYEKRKLRPSGDGKDDEQTMIMGCIPFRTRRNKDERNGGHNRVFPEKRRDGSVDGDHKLQLFSVRVGQVVIVSATNVMTKRESGASISPTNGMRQSDIESELSIFRLAHQIAPCVS